MKYHQKSRSYVKVTLTLLLVSASIFAKNVDPAAAPSDAPKNSSSASVAKTKFAETEQPKLASKEYARCTSEERPHFQKVARLIRQCQDDPESKPYDRFNDIKVYLQEHPDLIYRYNHRQETLLAIAAKFRKSHVAQLLIELGSDVNFPDCNGNTPLLIAIKNNRDKSDLATTATVIVLLTLGADIDHRNNEHYNAYQLACTLPHLPLTILNILSRRYGEVRHLTIKPKYK